MAILEPPEKTVTDPVEQAVALYETRLKSVLEPEYNGKTVAVHIDTGDYAIGVNSSRARFALRDRHPTGIIVTLDIGPVEAQPAPSRWLLESPGLWRRSG
jgi:hypothetical protein